MGRFDEFRVSSVMRSDDWIWAAHRNVAAYNSFLAWALLDAGDFDHSLELTFSGYDRATTLTNFPALIKLGPQLSGFSYDQLASDTGADLRFTDSDGATVLPYEIEKWDTNGISTVWVRVPELTSGGDSIWMHWGNTNLVTTFHPDGFDPDADISGCIVWLDSENVDGQDNATLSEGASVATWTNKATSGAVGDFAAPGENTVDPTFVASSVFFNGRPAVRLNGSGGTISVLTNAYNFASPCTVIYVSRLTGSASQRLLSGGANNWLLGYWSNSKDQAYFNGWVTGVGGVPADTATYVHEALISGAGNNSLFYRNGILVASNIGGTTGPDGLRLGGSSNEHSTGEIVELLIYNRVLTDDERDLVGTYLEEKYALVTQHSKPDVPDYTRDGSTWSEDYAGVWHLSRSDGAAGDSTAYGNNGGYVGGVPSPAAGIAGDGHDMNGGDYIDCGNAMPLNTLQSNLTVSMWIKPHSISGEDGLASKWNDSWCWAINSGFNRIYFSGTHGWQTAGTAVNLHQWNRVTMVYDETAQTIDFYLNGEHDGTLTETVGPGAGADLLIGHRGSGSGSGTLDAVADEVRVSSVTRSADWLWASYRNVAEYRAFVSTEPDASDYAHKLQLFFPGDARSEALTNFPLLVKLSTDIEGFSYAGFESDGGYDLRITDSDGVTFLDHEIEDWNTSGTSHIWVRKPVLSAATDSIWLYWGNSDHVSGYDSATFDPAADIADCTLWVKADTGVSTNASGGVTNWADQSGNGYDFMQPTASTQPTYAEDVVNGHDVVRLDATDDGMTNNLSLSAPYTMFIVFNCTAGGAQRRAIQGSNNWLIGPYNSRIAHYAGNGWVSSFDRYQDGAMTYMQEFFVCEANNTGASSLFRVDGVDRTTSPIPVGAPGLLALGGSGAYNEPLGGDIAEVIVYDRALLPEESARVGRYLAAKYDRRSHYQHPDAADSIVDGSTWSDDHVGVWHMTEPNAADSTAGENHAAYVNPGVQDAGTYGSVDGAQDYSSANNMVFIPGGNISSQIGSNITVSGHVFLEGAAGDFQPVVSEIYRNIWNQGDGNLIDFVLYCDNGKLAAAFYNGTWFRIWDSIILPRDRWVDVAATYDGHYMRLYRDGREVATSADLNLPLPSSALGWYIGHRHDGSHSWDGVIDEARIENTTRSAEWIETAHRNIEMYESFVNWHLTPSNFTHSMEFVFSGYDEGETLTNFPALIKLSRDLEGFDYGGFASAAGYDLRFTDSDGTTVIPYEVEEWDSNGTSCIWVQVPQLESTGADSIWAYWGNTDLTAAAPGYTANGAVWDDQFAVVWHLAATNGANADDSTADGIDGTVYNTEHSDWKDGIVGNAIELDGVDELIAVEFNVPQTEATHEMWVKGTTDNVGLFSANAPLQGGSNDRNIAIESRQLVGRLWNEQVITSSGLDLADGRWHHVVHAFGASIGGQKLYVDGVEVASGNKASSDFTGNTWIEVGWGSRGGYYAGMIDEPRISLNEVRSADWIRATYQNVANYEQFVGTPLTPGDYSHSLKIVFKGYDSGQTLTNFPALVKLSTDNPGFSYGGFASADGYDLRFTDSDGTTVIPYEVEKWNNAGESVVWVQVPELEGTGTDYIWAYWGDSDATNPPAYRTNGSTWSEDYLTVWHMTESSTDPEDSTSHNQDGVNDGLTTQVSGRIADCYEVDSDGDNIEIPYMRERSFSASLWYYYSAVHNDGWNTLFCKHGGGQHHILIEDSTRRVGFYNGGFHTSGEVLGLNQWHHLTIVVNGTNCKLYRNGTKILESNSFFDNAASPLRQVSTHNGVNQEAMGKLDEIRVMKGTRSDDWVRAAYQNMADTESFIGWELTPADFNHSMQITFDGYDKNETLTNFPALVRLSPMIPAICSSPSGYDLRFTDADGVTLLEYELDTWDATGTSYAWVKVPRLTNNASIWAYCGNPSDTTQPSYATDGSTWTEGFRGVWHMTDSNALDATENDLDGTAGGSFNTAGLIGGAQDFPTGNNWLSLPAQVSGTGNSVTLMGLANLRGDAGQFQAIMSERYAGDGNVEMTLYCDSGKLTVGFYNGSWHRIAETVNFPEDEWVHVAATYDGHYLRLYRNGVQMVASGDLNLALPVGSNGWYLGHRHDLTDSWDGFLDEMRVGHVTRSSNWVWACSLMMTDHDNFATYGDISNVGEPRYWDTSIAAGLQSGDGTWNSNTQLWSDVVGGSDPLVRWSPAGVANFTANGPATITVQGTPIAAGLVIDGSGHTLSGGSLSLGASGIVANAGATLNTPLSLDADQGWTVAGGQVLSVSSNLQGSGALTKLGAGTVSVPDFGTYSAAMAVSNGTLRLAGRGNATPPLAGYTVWLDAMDVNGNGTVPAHGATLSTWVNKASVGGVGHFTQYSYGASPPTYVASSLHFDNRPVVRFHGVNNLKSILYNTSNLPAPVTVVYVSRLTGGGNYRLLSGHSGNWLLGYHANTRDDAFFQGWVHNGAGGAGTGGYLYEAVIRGTGNPSSFYRDGTLLASNTAGVSGPNGLRLGGGVSGNNEHSSGEIAELLVYNWALSDVERAAVETYLQNKWSIGDLPNGVTLTVAQQGTLDLNGVSQGVQSFGDAGNGGGLVTNSSSTAAVLSLDGDVSTTFSGTIVDGSGATGLRKGGSGIFTLAGANTFSGGTRIDGGTLRLRQGDNRLLTTGTATFGGSATLDLGTNAQTLAALGLDGVTGTITGSDTLMLNGAQDLRVGGVWEGGAETLTMSGLANFVYDASANTFSVGGQKSGVGGPWSSGTATLAATNTITASQFGVADAGRNVSASSGNDGTVYLGQTNTIYADTIRVGANQSYGVLQFQGGLTAPVLVIRGTAGGSTRANVTLASNGSNYTESRGTLDLTNGVSGVSTLDALVDTLLVGRNGYGNAGRGWFYMGGGTLDATTIRVADSAGTGGAEGVASFDDGTVMAQTLTLGEQTSGTVTSTFTQNGGTLQVGTIGPGAGTATRTFNWNGGTIRNYDTNTDLAIGPLDTFALGAAGLVLDIDTNRQATVAPALSGTGGLVKNDEGELLLHGANTYSDATTVNAGYLWGTGSVANSSITVKEDAKIGPATGYTLGTLNANNVTLESGARVPCLINGTTPTLDVSGTLTTAETNWIDLVMTGPLVSGTYVLIDYTGSIAGDDFAAFKLSRQFGSRITATLVNNTVDTTIDLQVTVVPPTDIKWNGNNGVAWDVDATTNWLTDPGGVPITFIAGDTALFDDTAASFTVEAQEVVAPSNTLVTNSANDYTIGGEAIGGDGALTKQGTSKLTLTANNTYTGPTTVEAGTLQVGDGGTSGGLGSGAVTNLSTLAYKRSDTVSLDYQVEGAGVLAQTGSGTLSLDVADVVEGDLRVDDGVMQLGVGDAMSVGQAIDVNSGGTFDFNGQHNSESTRDYQFTAEGTGSAGQGAIVNTGASIGNNASVDGLTLTDNTTLGGVDRWDIGTGGVGPALDGGGFALAKVGAGEICIRPETIQNVTSVTINDGYIKYESFDRTTADTSAMIQYVSSGGSLGSYGTRTLNMPAVFNGGVLRNHGGGTATWTGDFTLNQTMTVNNSGGYMWLNGDISGSGGITAAGANNAVYVQGSNSYHGATIVSNGYYVVRNAHAFGNSSGIDVRNGATLQFEVGYPYANTAPITLVGHGVGGSRGALAQWTGANTLNNPISLAAYSRVYCRENVLTLGGAITGTNMLAQTGGGSIRLNGADDNTSTGMIIVENGYLYLAKTGGAKAISGPVQMGWPNNNQPHLRCEQPDQFASGVVMTFTNAWTRWARLSLQGHDQTLAGIQNTTGGAVIQNERQGGGGASSSGVLTIANDMDYVYRGYFRDEDDGGHTYTLGLTKAGTGKLTLMPPPGQTPRINYRGQTTVNGGTLEINDLTGGTMPFYSPITVNAGGTFVVNSSIAFATRWNYGLLLNGGGTFIKTGTGVFGITGSCSLSGEIQVQQGRLMNDATTANWSGASADIVISSGAVLDLRADDIRADGLSGDGEIWNSHTAGGTRTLTLGVANGGGTYNGDIRGTGGTGNDTPDAAPINVVKTGTNTQALAGANTYAGATTVNGGTLLVNGSHVNGATYTVNAGGTLGGTGTIETAVSIVAGGMLAGGVNGAGTLTTRNLTLATGATNLVTVGGAAPGTNYSQVAAVGTVNLGGSTLDVTFSYTPRMDDVYFIVVNDDADAVVGTFDGLAEGDTLVVTQGANQYPLIVTYQADAGTQSLTGGNDIALQYHYDLPTLFMIR